MLLASKDIVFDVAHNTQSSGNASAGKGWGFNNAAGLPYGNYNQQGTGNGQTDTITGTQLSVGGSASLTTTQGDISLTASNVAAQGNVSMRAAGDLTIQSGQDILGNTNQSTSKGIGTVVISDTERFAGYNKKNHTDDNAQVSQVASNVGSLGGNVSLTAGGAYTQSASNVVAAKDVDITAASIQLLTANSTSSASQQDDDLKIGAFARIKSPLIDLINNVDDARKSDGRLGAMQGMAAAANAYQSASAISSMAGGAGSGSLLSVEAGVGFATSESSFNSSSQMSQGSTITGGGNVLLKTTEGDLHIVQGNLKAGDTLSLDSARDLVLEAGNSSNTEQSKGSNAGFEVGVGASVGAQIGVYAYVQASAGSHKSNVDGSTWQNTQLAGQNIVLTSEGDTTLRGAVVKGDRIDAQIGGDLTIESLQDKLDIQSKESSVGGRVQVSAGTAWDASGYASGAKANGNYLGVVEQSGLFAGSGGYHVTAGNVNLIGGAIASTNAGASELTADSLTFTDLKNQMDYSAASGSISGGFGSTGNQTDANGNPIQRTAGEQSSDIGNNIANGNYGKANTGSFMPGVPMSESGSDTSHTRATLTEGTIKIGGKTTTAAATGINTDATAAHEAVATLPDVRKILGEQQAMAAAAGTVMATGKQIGDDIAASAENKAKAIEAEYKDGLKTQEQKDDFAKLTADQRRDVLIQSNPDYRAAYEAKQQWGVGGDYSRALQAVTTVLVGSVSGQGAGQVAGNALAPYAAQLVGKTFDQNHGSDPNAVLQGLSHAVLGAVLAQVNGTSMAGGALAGAGGELAAHYLTKALYGDDPQAYGPDGKFDPNRLPEADKQMLVSLSQAVGAIAGGMTGGSLLDAAVGAQIAGNAVTNNVMLSAAEISRLKEMANGDPQAEKQLLAAACARKKCSAGLPEDDPYRGFWAALEAEGSKPEYQDARDWLAWQSQTTTQFFSGSSDDFSAGVSWEKTVNLFGYGDSDALADWSSRNNVGTRVLGGLQTIGGASEAAGAIILAPSCATVVACALVGYLGFAGTDNAVTGFNAVLGGKQNSTLGGQALQMLGLSPESSEVIYGFTQVVPSVSASKSLQILALGNVGAIDEISQVAGGANKIVARSEAGIEWGKGIQGQGMPWENYLASEMPASSRLPPNFKTFDFYDEATRTRLVPKLSTLLPLLRWRILGRFIHLLKQILIKSRNSRVMNSSQLTLGRLKL
ncbi:filamentous hemagglutinin [Xanthomonas campestris]|nr:filamentous hemagglutinin [Xanthomonas campestris]